MSQFDVHPNLGRRSRATIPFVVILQSRLFDATSNRRLVAPLYRAAALPEALAGAWDRTLAPRFDIMGTSVLLNPLGATPVPAAELGPAVASLADDASATAIVASFDRAMTRAYG